MFLFLLQIYIRMIKIKEISKIGIGTYRMDCDIAEHLDTLNYAIESNINIIDTASNYNFGKSERLIGKVVNENLREKVFIISKVGYIQGEDINKIKNLQDLHYIDFNENFLYSLDPKFISFQLEESMKRLSTNYIDCYLLHNPEYYFDKGYSKENVKDIILESFSFLEEKVKKGEIRYYGISSNDLSKLSLIDLLDKMDSFSGFKFLQFPYNIVEKNNIFQFNNSDIITISELKEKGLHILSNRPLNTSFNSKVLRLSDNDNLNVDEIESQEELLFDSFQNMIKQQLRDIEEDDLLESYYPISFFIENRKSIANQEAIDRAINSYLIPFIDAIGLKKEKVFVYIRQLRNYWIIFSKKDNQKRLNILKENLYNDGTIGRNDSRDLSVILAENYIQEGVDTVLMGLRKREYIDKIKNIL